MDQALRDTTKNTARMLFHTLKGGTGFETWKKFDKELARELSMFFTGKLYSREVISQKQRELCAVASLTVLNRRHEELHPPDPHLGGADRAGGARGDHDRSRAESGDRRAVHGASGRGRLLERRAAPRLRVRGDEG